MKRAASLLTLALLVSSIADARNFAKSYAATPNRTFDAILRLVQEEPRARLIDMDIAQRLIHFRLALDSGSKMGDSALDQFSGMYVLLQVSASGTSKVIVNVTADRIYPLGAATHQAHSAEESAYVKDFLRKLQQELKR